MLSDSPPDRDVIWSDERVGRLALRAAAMAAGEWIRRDRESRAGDPADVFGTEALTLRKAAHGALDKVSSASNGCIFNVCLAHIRELAMLAEVLGLAASGMTSPPGGSGGVGHSCSTVRAHDAASGRGVLAGTWPVRADFESRLACVERDLLVEDTVMLVVQVNGKKRGDVTVPRGAQNPEIEAAVLALDAVKSALGGKPVRKVIVIARRDRRMSSARIGIAARLLAVAALTLTAGCFQPMYAEHADGTPPCAKSCWAWRSRRSTSRTRRAGADRRRNPQRFGIQALRHRHRHQRRPIGWCCGSRPPAHR